MIILVNPNQRHCFTHTSVALSKAFSRIINVSLNKSHCFIHKPWSYKEIKYHTSRPIMGQYNTHMSRPIKRQWIIYIHACPCRGYIMLQQGLTLLRIFIPDILVGIIIIITSERADKGTRTAWSAWSVPWVLRRPLSLSKKVPTTRWT